MRLLLWRNLFSAGSVRSDVWMRKRALEFPGQFQMCLKQPRLFMKKHKWLLALSRACGRDRKVCFVVFVGQYVRLKQAEARNFCILLDLLKIQVVPREATNPFSISGGSGISLSEALRANPHMQAQRRPHNWLYSGVSHSCLGLPCASTTLS